jgi:hypothetical protein
VQFHIISFVIKIPQTSFVCQFKGRIAQHLTHHTLHPDIFILNSSKRETGDSGGDSGVKFLFLAKTVGREGLFGSP